MPSLKAAVVATATTTHEIKLSPQVKKKLLTAYRTYAELSLQKKAIKAAQAKLAKTVEDIQVDLGETHLEVDGFKSTIVAPVQRKLDKKLFVSLGGRLDLLEAASPGKPGKSYVKITAPGAKDEEGDE